jgi:hypothetical protein
VTTSAEVLEQLKNLEVKDFDEKIIIDPKINPITTTPEQASAIVKEQIDTVVKKGVSPANIGIVGLDVAFSGLNQSIELITNSLGVGFGGAFENFMSMDSYLSDLDEVIENKILSSAALASTAIKVPDNIPVDESLVKKYARKVSGLDALGNEQVNFPDTFLPEERPIDGKTPLSDWKDRTKVTVETAGGGVIKEKASEFAADYGKNILIKSNTGHFIEMDDTEGKERINIQHKNGAFITIHQDKSIVIRGQNGIQIITYANNELFVGGNINITVIGNTNISTNGNTNIDTVGDVNWKVGGDFNLDVAGDTFLANRGDIKMTARQIRQNAGDPRVLDNVKKKEHKLGS